MKTTLLIMTALLTACSGSTVNEDGAVFITKLGNDTLAVEQFEKTAEGITAKVILRSPSTTLTSYYLTQDDKGGIKTMVASRHSLEEGFEGDGEFHQQIELVGDTLGIGLMRQGEMRLFSVENKAGTLPFIDMVHWPFELAFNNAKGATVDTVNQSLLSGSRISNFVIASITADSMTLRHPSRGVMGTRVSPEGELLFLDAGLTTRKLKVYREDYNSVDMQELAVQFGTKDISGNPFGELSGAVESSFYIGNDEYKVTYGSPRKRGRDLFGGIVSYGERWRTGANRATHFYTSKDLMFGDISVPAGEYTLFSIPEADGGTLIINKQTGQNGRTYDEARDQGRVDMIVSTKEDNTEAFTIEVAETESGGSLNLIWGNTVYSIPFTIK